MQPDKVLPNECPVEWMGLRVVLLSGPPPLAPAEMRVRPIILP